MAGWRRAALALAGAALLLDLAPLAEAKTELVATDANIANPHYEPTEPVAAPGSPVVVRNTGSDRHTVTSVDQAWPEVELGPGESKSFNAPAANGTYRFYCRYHASPAAQPGQGMAGALHVQAVADQRTPLGAELLPVAIAGAALLAGRKRNA
ncbi:MAG TPA: cupredoxin domain-containing protein [Candidatus Thermoplasmatota archaeon]|jgi:plastocyanin|nr:cupredoxin domain-containing protein [Candidatus Thermoplasmatota archaeon]